MFDRIDFIYLPSRDVAADLAHFTQGLGGEVVFAIEACGTRVAMVRLAPDPPPFYSRGIFTATNQSSCTASKISIGQSQSSATVTSRSAWISRSLTGAASR